MLVYPDLYLQHPSYPKCHSFNKSPRGAKKKKNDVPMKIHQAWLMAFLVVLAAAWFFFFFRISCYQQLSGETQWCFTLRDFPMEKIQGNHMTWGSPKKAYHILLISVLRMFGALCGHNFYLFFGRVYIYHEPPKTMKKTGSFGPPKNPRYLP